MNATQKSMSEPSMKYGILEKLLSMKGAKAILAMTTPELIAIFQTGNLSDEWMEKFRVRGAYITNISRRKEVSHE
jgi:hypothetical protein